MNLDDLEIFRSVVREGGVSRAASQLNRVPSNVTTRIKQLEERLGVSLFRRVGRGLATTAAGDMLLAYADRLLQMAEQAEKEVQGGLLKGVLRLGSLESAAGARLPPILSNYHLQHADVSIELQTGTTGALLKLLERFEIEAAFVSEPFETGAHSSIAVFEEELVLITPKSATSIKVPADLNGKTLIAFPHGCSYRRRLVEWLSHDGNSPRRILDLGSYHAIVACVSAGAGVAIVPAAILDQVVLGAAVMRQGLPKHLRVSKTHLVWKEQPSPALVALLDLLPKC